MRFLTSSLFALVALASAVMAAENPIIRPDATTPMTVGVPFDITWTPTTSGVIKLTLRQGPSGNLHDVEVIVANYQNSGTFTWTPDSSLPAGTDYAIMITDDHGDVNYTPLITILSDTAPVSSTSSSSVKPSKTTESSSSSTTKAESSPSSTTKAESSSTTKGESSSTTKAESSTITSSAVMTMSANSTTLVTSMTGTAASNATTTGIYGNSTSSSTTSSSHSTRSSGPTTSPTTTAVSTGAAAGLLKSPLALVVCLIGAVVYLN